MVPLVRPESEVFIGISDVGWVTGVNGRLLCVVGGVFFLRCICFKIGFCKGLPIVRVRSWEQVFKI